MTLKVRSYHSLQRIAVLVLLTSFPLSSLSLTLQQKRTLALSQFERAERLREALNGRPQSERTRHDYQTVIDAYRRVYYTTPATSKADNSILATAELQAEMGRTFNEPKALKDAIASLEFLRREYPGSRYRVNALFTIGQIYRVDLDDSETAKATFEEFLRLYPHSQMAPQARKEIAEIDAPPPAPAPAEEKKRAASTTVNGVRFWSTPDYTRVAIDLDEEVKYEAARLPRPDRIFFDLHNARLASTLPGKSFDVGDGFLRTIRVAPYQKNVVRIVLDVQDVSDYSAFLLPNPYRLIIDVHGRKPASAVAKVTEQEKPADEPAPATAKLHSKPRASAPAEEEKATPSGDSAPKETAVASAPSASREEKQQSTSETENAPPVQAKKPARKPAGTFQSANEIHPPQRAAAVTPKVGVWDAPAKRTEPRAKAAEPAVTPEPQAKSGEQMRKEAAEFERKYKEAEAAGKPLPKPNADLSTPLNQAGVDKATEKPTSEPTYETVSKRPDPEPAVTIETPKHGKKGRLSQREVAQIHAAMPNAHGERSLVRALGLKIGKIVVDAGHGGHDTGTVGPSGFMEKDLVLDVSLRLGKLLESRLGADVVYTRDDDTFIPLETRTAVANKEQADLFVSVHANSSRDSRARGVETYYLNFTSEPSALEVAARENAVSQTSIHELQDLVKKITLKDKIDESRELASDVQQSLYTGLTLKGRPMRNRGVKKAPFIVLIGANMPSILAEVSFLSNPGDEKKLKSPEYRQKVAESLYKGIAKYISSLSSFRVAQVKPAGGN